MTHRDESVERGAEFLDANPAQSVPAPLIPIVLYGQPGVRSLEIGELLTYAFPVPEPILGPWLR